MKKRMLIAIVVILGLAMMVSPIWAKGGGGTNRGVASDPNAEWLGPVKYLGNPAGYHFWFTPTASLGSYEAGHSYHNVYKLQVDDESEWCYGGPAPNRPPYNRTGHTGQMVYYKIFDTTTGDLVRPPC